MAVKKTIAIVTGAGLGASQFANKLAKKNYRILLMSGKSNQSAALLENIKNSNAEADVELIDCLKDGCWEADIIILDVVARDENEVAARIKEVATQKIVINIIEEGDDNKCTEEIKKLLPNSKVINAFYNADSTRIVLSANEQAIMADVAEMLEDAGFACSVALAG